MASPNSNTALPSLSEVCQGSLQWRVQSATRIISECPSKEASTVFRTLVQSVFGAAGPAEPGVLGWGLQVFTRAQHPAEYQQLLAFLSAQGPLVSMALKHAQDPFMHFEFPVALLPASAQAGIAEGNGGALYAGKLQHPGPGKLPHNILLNSFEFYMFHFSYYLLHVGGGSDGVGGGMAWTCVGDAVYPTLLEDYLNTFLPCDGSPPPALPPQLCAPAADTPLANRLGVSSLQHLSSLMSPISTPQLLGRGGPVTSPHLSAAPHTSSPLLRPNPHQQPQRHAAWTSQTLAQILVEMWINRCQPVVGGGASGGGRLPLHPHTSPSAHTRSPYSPPSLQHHQQQLGAWSECSTPIEYRPNWFVQPPPFSIGVSIMSEHIRAVRMIIKHFHYFSNSVKPAQPSPLDNLRRSLWPMCRASFYQMFVQLLARWPLDSSFRLLLEAWLSYIQPWRYTDINRSSDAAESSSPVEWHWQKFVADNLLLYSSILGLVLPRLLRLDLSAPKNAHMLYRISKVLSLPNLSSLLLATEEALHLQCSPHPLLPLPHTPGHPTDTPLSQQGGQLSPQAAVVAARAHIHEMEGSNHVYTPVFGQQTQDIVRQVLCNVRSAEVAVRSELEASSAAQSSSSSKGGVMGWVQGLLAWLETAAAAGPTDNTTEELQRSLLHLQAAAAHLHSLFQISENSVLSVSSEGSPSKSRSAVPDQINTANGMVLTDEGRRQLVSGLRRKDIKYEGDPDLRPIRFGELALLVRWLYVFAMFLNTKYSSRLSSCYYSSGVLGVLWRCVLQPPLTVYEYHKPGSAEQHNLCYSAYPTRRARQLPPRLSFRKAANRQVVVSVVAASLLLHVLFSVHLPTQLLYVALPLLLLYFSAQLLLCTAVLRPPPHPSPSLLQQQN